MVDRVRAPKGRKKGTVAAEFFYPRRCGSCTRIISMDDLRKPILPGKGASDYERYLRTDELLALQKSPEEFRHPDELLFQTVHQSSELWLKLGTTEVARATVHLRAGELAAALRLLTRASLCLQFITRQLDMLEQMSPWEY